jgi:PAS domain S-box-containing protein
MKNDFHDHENPREVERLHQELRCLHEVQEQTSRSEDLYRTIFETAGTAIITIDSDTTIRLANSNFEKLSGYSKLELEGIMKWTVFIAEEDLERMKTYHEQRRIDQTLAPSEYEFRFVDRSGRKKDILLNIAMIPGTQQSVASCMDITARKNFEEALRLSEENYRNILSTIQEVYYEVDLKGNFTFFNPMAWKALGYAEEELTNMNFRKYMDTDNIRKVFDVYHKVYMSGESVTAMEFDAIKANGERLPAEASVSLRKDAHGEVIGFKGVVRDISRRKESETAMRRSEERYRLMAENSSDVIWTLSLDGMLTYISPSIKAFSGYDPDELIGKGIDKILTPESCSFVNNTLMRELVAKSEKHGQAGRFELIMKTRDGTIKNIEVSTTWILNDKREPVGLQGSTRDITERKQAEEALRRSEEKYRNILASIQEGYFETELQGHFTFFNDSFCAMVGYPPEEVKGCSYKKIRRRGDGPQDL